MADDIKKVVNDRIEREDKFAVPGTRRAAEKDRAAEQQGVLSDAADGLGMTAAAGGLRVLRDEGPENLKTIHEKLPATSLPVIRNTATAGAAALTLMGWRSGKADYDKDEKYDELTQGIPYEYHDDILDNDNLAAAHRARSRVLADLERGKRIASQDSGQLAVLAGSLFDVDAPLTAFSGGAYASAKVAGAAMKAARLARLSPRAALRLSGAAQGANAGLQAGVVVGAVDAHVNESTTWQDMAQMSMQSMLLGSAVGGALKGDVRLSAQAAQKDFYERIARDDAAFRDSVDMDNMPAEPILEPVMIEDTGVGAQQVNPVPRAAAHVVVPVSGASPTNMTWIDGAKRWRKDSGWGQRKADDDDTWWGKVTQSKFMNLTTNNFNRLYGSKSAVANYIAGTVFESPSGIGRGRATASSRMEYYHRRIQTHLGEGVREAQAEWAKKTNNTWQGSGYQISQQGLQVFNREVMLELNDRRLGRTSGRSPEIKRAADQYELAGAEALGIGRGKGGETAVDGFDTIPNQRGYTPYMWSGRKIDELEKAGVVTRDNLINALASSYRKAGMGSSKDAEAVAKAVLHRAVTKDADMDTSVMGLLSGDGKDFLRESLIQSGVKEAEADIILDRLTGAQHNKSKEAFAKSRNDVDMDELIQTADGSELRVVDLLDQDMHGVWQRYARQMSGSAALARQGITNRAQRKEIIDAMRVEQRALGEEPMEEGLIEAMFSHFNAGPVHGFAAGATNEGIGHAALAKRITNLALLEKLGATQIAETGVIIAQNGLANWMRRGPMAVLRDDVKAGNKEVLDDLAFLTGEIGQDHWHFAPWLDLDDTTRADRGNWLNGVNKAASVGSFVQGYTSAFNQVRSFQQRTVALGVSDKIFRELKSVIDRGVDLDDVTRSRFENDLGLFEDDIRELEQMILTGVIEFDPTGKFVNRLNTRGWDPDIGERFAAAVTRNMNQLVQKSMAGEQDAWMHTHVGSILMHLKTFPLQAMQKQVMRNAKHLDKQSFATVLYGMATAAVAVQVRDMIDGKEQRDFGDLSKAAFNYSNMTGFIPTLVDPVMSVLGLDNHRINQYGPNYDITPPVLRVMNDMMRVPGALAATATGDQTWHDKQALKTLPFAGTYFLSRIFD